MSNEDSIRDLPIAGFLRLPQVLELFPVSRSVWWAGVKSGAYPKGIKLSERCVAWRASDIRKLMEEIGY